MSLKVPAGDHVQHRQAAAAVGHVDDVHAGQGLEHLAGKVRARAVAGRGVVEPARVVLGVAHQLGHRGHRQRRRHHQHQRDLGHARDRREVGHRVETQLAVQRLVDRVRAVGAVEQGVAVGRGLRHRLRADVAAGAAAVVDEHRLAEDLRQPRRDAAGDGVGPAAGGEGHDEPDRLVGVLGGGHAAGQQAQGERHRTPPDG
jgi:hypothetical protein